MVLDTSALLAILLDEPERSAFVRAIERDPTRLMSVANFVECSLVIEARFGVAGSHDLDLFIARAQVTMAPVDVDQAFVARQAYRKFGKGRHAAALNFGDCFAYALSRTQGEPLLFKGADFALTDVEQAIEAAAP
jgi:ribonuclease VapC